LIHFYKRQTPTAWLWTADYVSWTEDVEQRDGLSADPECV